ncbi:MAG: asparaginase [Burkholderiales bacterium]|nr:asparaginase [Burkholderiales bacterium]
MNCNPVLVEALRGGAVESLHRGAFAIVDADGAPRASAGDIDRPIFPRSAVKLLQALPLVASGAADALALGDAELALACASHGGDAAQVGAAAAMLAKAGLDESVLECGAHRPYDEAAADALVRAGSAARPLHNNCSGKHAGFVCLGCFMAGRDADAAARRGFLAGYVRPEHPVMREVSAALQAATGWDLARSPRATDGCSIPTHAIPLRQLALAYARVATGQGLSPGHARAAARLRAAIAAAPRMLGARGRADPRLMERLGARVCCKVGAEGVYCAALPELGLGLAIKVDDGTSARAAEVVLATALQALLPLSGDDAELVATLAAPRLVNWRGVEVGQLRATAALTGALGASGGDGRG